MSGWSRLWLVGSALIFVYALVLAMSDRQLALPDQACLPTTASTWVDEELVRKPTEEEIANAKAQLERSLNSSKMLPDEIATVAYRLAERQAEKEATFVKCTTYDSFFGKLWLAFLGCVALAIGVFLLRWVCLGFVKGAHGNEIGATK
jgi:hypothetical protein